MPSGLNQKQCEGYLIWLDSTYQPKTVQGYLYPECTWSQWLRHSNKQWLICLLFFRSHQLLCRWDTGLKSHPKDWRSPWIDLHTSIYKDSSLTFTKNSLLLFLGFTAQVTLLRSCQAIHIHTHLSWAGLDLISAHTLASNWQMPFLDQEKGQNVWESISWSISIKGPSPG